VSLKSSLYLIAFCIFYLFSTGIAWGQTPKRVNYQAVARDAESGIELSNQAVFLVAKIIQTSSDGELIYQEEHPNITTNDYGLFSIQIGNGDPVMGNFDEINWGSNQYWLEIDIDLGDGLETMGSMQFVSVPYALHAETVSNPEDADPDPTNELVESLEFNPEANQLTLIEGNQQLTVNLQSLIEDSDADPTNELVQSLDFSNEENELTLSEGGQELTVNLQSLVNDADADPSNEAISNFTLDGDFLILNEQQDWAVNLGQFYDDADPDPLNELIVENGLSLSSSGIFTISEGGTANSVDLSPLFNDADSDPTNEAIPDDGLNLLNDTILQITEGATLHELNLADLRDDEDWQKSESEEFVYNTEQSIGIGTSQPTSTLDLKGSLGVSYTIIENDNISSYTVTDEDHLIVFRLESGGADPFVISLPNAADCPGRMLEFVRKGPSGIDIEVLFGGSDLDFEPPSIPYEFGGSPFDEVTKFVSLGSEGWIRIDI